MEQNTPRLLTEAQVRTAASLGQDYLVKALRECGLIAEPVDPLADIAAKRGASGSRIFTIRSDNYCADLAEAYRRGRELAKPLTREMVRTAVCNAGLGRWLIPGAIDCIYDDLMEQMK